MRHMQEKEVKNTTALRYFRNSFLTRYGNHSILFYSSGSCFLFSISRRQNLEMRTLIQTSNHVLFYLIKKKKGEKYSGSLLKVLLSVILEVIQPYTFFQATLQFCQRFLTGLGLDQDFLQSWIKLLECPIWLEHLVLLKQELYVTPDYKNNLKNLYA